MSQNCFLRGYGSVLDLFPSERNVSISIPTHSDEEAIRKDLQQIGNDMYLAIKTVDQSLNQDK